MIHDFVKSSGIIPQVLTQILDQCVNGVTLSDPDIVDNPIVYANEAFESITGYSRSEMIGQNCRFLQGNDREQPEIDKLNKAIHKHQAIEVTLRNYKKNGELFYNQLSIKPLFDQQGNTIYYLGVQHDVTVEIKATQEIARLEQQLSDAISM